MGLTMADLARLKQEGNIRGYGDTNKKQTGNKKTNSPNPRKNKTKAWIGKNLWAWCRANKLTLNTEFKFHPERKFKFDWFIVELNTGIEYEGLMSAKSRHTTVTGFTGDANKYNECQKLGYKVLRYTAKNYKNIINDLNNLLNLINNS